MDKVKIDIYYCQKCNFLLRAAWMAQEILHTYGEDLESLTLHPDSGGRYRIVCNETEIWEKKRDGGFPDAKIIKQRIRDIFDPKRDLGHIDRK